MTLNELLETIDTERVRIRYDASADELLVKTDRELRPALREAIREHRDELILRAYKRDAVTGGGALYERDTLIDLAGQCYALVDPIYREDKERGHALDDRIMDAVMACDGAALEAMLRELDGPEGEEDVQPALFRLEGVPAEAKDRGYSDDT